jgi:hypothetical protein
VDVGLNPSHCFDEGWFSPGGSLRQLIFGDTDRVRLQRRPIKHLSEMQDSIDAAFSHICADPLHNISGSKRLTKQLDRFFSAGGRNHITAGAEFVTQLLQQCSGILVPTINGSD